MTWLNQIKILVLIRIRKTMKVPAPLWRGESVSYSPPLSWITVSFPQFHWGSPHDSVLLALTPVSPFCYAVPETALLNSIVLLPPQQILPADREDNPVLFQICCPSPHSMGNCSRGTRGTYSNSGNSFVDGSYPITTTSIAFPLNATPRILWVLPNVHGGK